jgi:alpha-N-arabinofuranosidase
MSQSYHNPIIPGFYPDPSLCRVGEDYYLITSSFEYFPGLPLFHSRDLVNWRQIGHVLNRPSQLPLDGIRPSGGLYAPTIRYFDGTFYVINTLVDGLAEQGNFIVTATDPAGPWSEPFWLDDAPGIDPSLLFDEDGRVWYCGNRRCENYAYEGDTEIWLQELDLDAMQLTGPKYAIWRGALRNVQWPEAPHIYKIEGKYYLLIAEGGTGHNHAVTIARAEQVTGPYKPNPRNPILTHRHLGLDYPIVGTGHADLVETQKGDWWMVLLAMRPYEGYFYNLGRETFLAPVRWEEGWPVVAPGEGKVLFNGVAPDLPAHPWPVEPACDHFDGHKLGYAWNFIRTPREVFWSLTENPGFLRLKLRPETLMERVHPSFVGRRQQHINFSASAVMDFIPKTPYECAGIALLQRDTHQIRCMVTLNDMGNTIVQLVRRENGLDERLFGSGIKAGRIYFKIEVRGQAYSFFIADSPGQWLPLGNSVDGRVLSTPVAGGFTGAYIGMYASSNGHPSENFADFDWFEISSQ